MAQEDLAKVAADLRTEVERAAGAVRDVHASTMASVRSHHAMDRELNRPAQARLHEPTPIPSGEPPATGESRLATALLFFGVLLAVALLLALAWSPRS